MSCHHELLLLMFYHDPLCVLAFVGLILHETILFLPFNTILLRRKSICGEQRLEEQRLMLHIPESRIIYTLTLFFLHGIFVCFSYFFIKLINRVLRNHLFFSFGLYLFLFKAGLTMKSPLSQLLCLSHTLSLWFFCSFSSYFSPIISHAARCYKYANF